MFATFSTKLIQSAINVIVNSILFSFVCQLNNFKCIFSDENTPAVRIYVRVNIICEMIIKWSMIFILLTFVMSTSFTSVAGVIYHHLKDGHVEMENLYMPLKLKCVAVQLIHSMHANFTNNVSYLTFIRMPFDPSTVGGFTGIQISVLIYGMSYLTVVTAFGSFFLSMGLFLRAFHSHYESMFSNMDAIVAEGPLNSDRLLRLKAVLIDAINFHEQAKG